MSEMGDLARDPRHRKLARLNAGPRRPPRKSPALDENNQLQLSEHEQAELDRVRREQPDMDREFFRIWWQERLRAARRVFNDPEQVERIVSALETATGPG